MAGRHLHDADPPDAEAASRRRTVVEAGLAGDPEAGTPVARRHLEDPESAVRSAALGALALLGTLEPATLVGALGDRDPAVRRRALELCVDADPAGTLPLGLLDDPDPTVVEVACWVAGELVPTADRSVQALAGIAVGHDDPLCREAAVAALGALGHPDGLDAVLAALDDRPQVRRRAVLALAPFDGPEVDAALERALGDRDWQVRQAAEDLLPDPPAGD